MKAEATRLPRTMGLAWASMLFSTNSAIAFKGLLCESAMFRIAFQSCPIRRLPLSLLFAYVHRWELSRTIIRMKHEGLALVAGQSAELK
jgi:hypothetical protein